jgi:hypothetical protein
MAPHPILPLEGGRVGNGVDAMRYALGSLLS